MKFKVDENLPVEVAELLRNASHEASTVAEEGLSGSADAAVIDVARSEGRAFLTLDLDFSDIRAYPPSDYLGIVVFRPYTQDKITLVSLAGRMLPLLSTELLPGNLWIVEDDRVRIHPGPNP